MVRAVCGGCEFRMVVVRDEVKLMFERVWVRVWMVAGLGAGGGRAKGEG